MGRLFKDFQDFLGCKWTLWSLRGRIWYVRKKALSGAITYEDDKLYLLHIYGVLGPNRYSQKARSSS